MGAVLDVIEGRQVQLFRHAVTGIFLMQQRNKKSDTGYPTIIPGATSPWQYQREQHIQLIGNEKCHWVQCETDPDRSESFGKNAGGNFTPVSVNTSPLS